MEVVHGVGQIDRIVFEEDEDMVVQEVMKLLQDGRRRSSERTRSYETKERKETRPPKAKQEPPFCPTTTGALFYSVDGDVVPKYPVEFNSDAASSVMETPGRSMRRRRSPETRFTYNESLQQDIIEEIDMVKFRYDGLDAEPAKPKRLAPRSTSTKSDLTPRSTHTEQTSSSSSTVTPPPKESITTGTAPTAAWSPSGLRHLLPKLPCGGLAAISSREYYTVTSATPHRTNDDAPVESPLTCYSPRHHRCRNTTSNVLADIHKADVRRRRQARVTKRLDAVASACALREDAIDDATTELDSHHRREPFSVGATSAFTNNGTIASALSSVTSGSHSLAHTASSRTASARFSWEGTFDFSGTANDYSSPGRKSVFSNTESFHSSRQSAFSNSDSLSFFILAENPDDLGYAASFM